MTDFEGMKYYIMHKQRQFEDTVQLGVLEVNLRQIPRYRRHLTTYASRNASCNEISLRKSKLSEVITR